MSVVLRVETKTDESSLEIVQDQVSQFDSIKRRWEGFFGRKAEPILIAKFSAQYHLRA